MEQELRRMFEIKEIEMTVPPTLSHELRKRIGRQRMVMGGLATAAAVAVVLGGFAGARSLSNDEALPPVNPDRDESTIVGTWVSRDIDGSDQRMVVQATGEGGYEIVNRDDFGVCSGAPSTMTGTGRLDGANELVIPSPAFTCDDGSEPEVESYPPFTLVHDPEAGTLTDNFNVVWKREQISETEVARGVYEGTPWRLNIFAHGGIDDTGELNHSLSLRGYLGDEIFGGYSWINLNSELEAAVGGAPIEGRNPPLMKNPLQDALVVFGAVKPNVARVEFSEGGQTLSAETIAVPAEMGDDFRVFVLFAPFGTDVACFQGSVPTVDCFGREQRVVGLDASGEIVTEELLHLGAGSGRLEGLDYGHGGLRVDEPDPDEFVAEGSEGALSWRLRARRFESLQEMPAPGPSWRWRCFGLSLAGDPQGLEWRPGGILGGGGLGCLIRPGAGWFGEVAQRVEPLWPEVAPVYGAIPSHVDEVKVLLDDGSEIPAHIFRPENHSLAYFLAWIPDAYAAGSVRFSADGNELGSRSLCAADYRDEAVGFVCYGTPAE